MKLGLSFNRASLIRLPQSFFSIIYKVLTPDKPWRLMLHHIGALNTLRCAPSCVINVCGNGVTKNNERLAMKLSLTYLSSVFLLLTSACGVQQTSTLDEDLPSGRQIFSETQVKESKLNPAEVADILKRVDEFCESGCEFKASAVVSQQVLERDGNRIVSHTVASTPLGSENSFF